MDTTRRIAIVQHRRSLFPLDMRQAIGPDLEPIWVLAEDEAADPAMRRVLARTGRLVDIAGLPLDEAVERVAAEQPEGIVTGVDETLELTAALAVALELPYHSPQTAHTVADKGLQRGALAQAGVSGPRFWIVPAGLGGEALADAAREPSYPSVLKPTAGSGGRGVRRLVGPEDLVAAYRPDTPVVVEEYLTDTDERDLRFASYLSVESVICDGQISHVALCGRFQIAPPFRESGFFIPAAIDPERHAPLTALADEAIRALGITIGMTHTEIKLTTSGPRVIEVNARLGGRPPLVLRSVSDVNLLRLSCLVALGDKAAFPQLAPTREIGFWRLVQPPVAARSVRSVEGIKQVSASPAVDHVSLVRAPGDPVDWREGSAGHVAYVNGRVADLDELATTIEFIDSTLQFAYDCEPAPMVSSPLTVA
jgi:hypothetical protein